MKKQDFYRTDLLVESEEMVRHRTKKEKDALATSSGVEFQEEVIGRVKITKVFVDKNGAEQIGKKEGSYITLTAPTLRPDDDDAMQQITQLLVSNMVNILVEKSITSLDKILFVGLGNREVTPDAIGPFTMDRVRDIVPKYFTDHGGEVFVYAPGVTVQTGLETADFIQALVQEIQPDILVVVDALAARDSNRLCRTIQLTDTGIHPGSGVGNNRKEVSQETLGIPVLAIGIPTVVDGPVLVADAIDTMFNTIAGKIEEDQKPSARLSVSTWLRSAEEVKDHRPLTTIFGEWAEWPHAERIQLFEEVLANHNLKTFISPKEIDLWIASYAMYLSKALTEWIQEYKQ